MAWLGRWCFEHRKKVVAAWLLAIIVITLMHLTGPANWALPAWLDRILPRVEVETAERSAEPVKGSGGPLSGRGFSGRRAD